MKGSSRISRRNNSHPLRVRDSTILLSKKKLIMFTLAHASHFEMNQCQEGKVSKETVELRWWESIL